MRPDLGTAGWPSLGSGRTNHRPRRWRAASDGLLRRGSQQQEASCKQGQAFAGRSLTVLVNERRRDPALFCGHTGRLPRFLPPLSVIDLLFWRLPEGNGAIPGAFASPNPIQAKCPHELVKSNLSVQRVDCSIRVRLSPRR